MQRFFPIIGAVAAIGIGAAPVNALKHFKLPVFSQAGMVSGWPDVILCRDDGQPHDIVSGVTTGRPQMPALTVNMATELPGHDGRFHYGQLTFNADGTSYRAATSIAIYTSDCANKSISALVANGQARTLNVSQRDRGTSDRL